jgi:hypothetical protein
MSATPLVVAAIALSVPTFLAAQLPAYNIPDDPAFTFLGVAPKNVANPGTLPKLGLAIADGIDIEGRVNTGLAVSFLPSTIIRFSPTPERYRNGTPAFWLYNTQFSLATVRASGDTGSTDMGYGLRTIFRGPEPYTDTRFRDAIASVLDRCLAAGTAVDSSTLVIEDRAGVRPLTVRNPDDPTKMLRPSEGTPISEDTLELTYLDSRGKPTRTERVVVRKIRNGSRITQDTVRVWRPGANTIDANAALDCANRGKARVLRRWMEQHWNDATLALSLAAGTRFGQAAIRRTHSLGGGLWMLGGLPIRRTRGHGADASITNVGEVAAQLHYAGAPRSAPIAPRNSWDWGVRAMAGSARSNAFAELTRGLRKGQKRSARAWSTGLEYMAAESIWLSVGIGGRFSEVSKNDKTFVFMHLKWGLARESELGAR